MIKKMNIPALFALAALCLPFQSVQAVVLDVTQLTIDNISANVSVGSLPGTGASSSIVPPAELLMGSYQSSIFSFTETFPSGSFDGLVYTTGMYGDLAPSASVDTVAGNFSSLDLSSLRLSGMLNIGTGAFSDSYSFDTGFWPFTTPMSSSSYNAMTGEFSLSWVFADNIEVYQYSTGNTYNWDSSFDVTISGTLSAVPLPAAVWLFVSGALALAGFVRRKPQR